MSAHTPAPWEYKPPVAPGEKPVVRRGIEGILWLIGTSREQEEADGHLIAAAPELLESVGDFLALRDWMVLVGGTEGPVAQDLIEEQARRSMAAVKRARAALAKARGSES